MMVEGESEDYALLRQVSGWLCGVGLLSTVLGITALLFGLFALSTGGIDEYGTIVLLSGGISGVFAGLLMTGVGQGLFAVRDIAINSWYWRR